MKLNFNEGSAAHARALAACMNGSLCGLGPTDAALAGAALRSYAGRGVRRAGTALVAIGMVATLAIVGIEDRDRNGRVDFVDAISGVHAALASTAHPRILEKGLTR